MQVRNEAHIRHGSGAGIPTRRPERSSGAGHYGSTVRSRARRPEGIGVAFAGRRVDTERTKQRQIGRAPKWCARNFRVFDFAEMVDVSALQFDAAPAYGIYREREVLQQNTRQADPDKILVPPFQIVSSAAPENVAQILVHPFGAVERAVPIALGRSGRRSDYQQHGCQRAAQQATPFKRTPGIVFGNVPPPTRTGVFRAAFYLTRPIWQALGESPLFTPSEGDYVRHRRTSTDTLLTRLSSGGRSRRRRK
jgi:hypothetical protein